MKSGTDHGFELLATDKHGFARINHKKSKSYLLKFKKTLKTKETQKH